MKLITNKDRKCPKCDVFVCCSELYCNEIDHKFCWSCGEPIEWITERSVEEVLEAIIIKVRELGKQETVFKISEITEDMKKEIDSLKQELLNKINN